MIVVKCKIYFLSRITDLMDVNFSSIQHKIDKKITIDLFQVGKWSFELMRMNEHPYKQKRV